MPATQSYTVTHVGISTARLALQAQGSAKNQTWFGRRRALPMRIKKTCRVQDAHSTCFAPCKSRVRCARSSRRRVCSSSAYPSTSQATCAKQAKGSAESRRRRAVQVHLSPCAEPLSIQRHELATSSGHLAICSFESTQHKRDAGAGLCITRAQAKGSAFLCT